MVGKIFKILIVLLGVAMAVPQSRARMVEEARPYIDNFRAKLVPARLEKMADQLEVRYGRGEGFPANFEGWLRRSYSGVETDPWDNPWFLDVRRDRFTVGSLGPDGEPRTPDDITLTRRLDRRGR